MSATISLASPVTTLTRAQALAESVREAGGGAGVGPAIDRILVFLAGLDLAALAAGTEGVLDVLHLLGTARSQQATRWLTVRAPSVEAARYWSELHELSSIDIAA